MNRTFTLQRLLFNVTLLAVALAIIRAYPQQSVHVGVFIAAFVPATLISILFAYFSRRPKQTLAIALLGTVLGWLMSPRIYVSFGPPASGLDVALLNLQIQALPTAIGAALFGGPAIWFARWQRRQVP